MNAQDIRWEQRYRQFSRAFSLLQDAMAVDSPSVLERAGMIQFFEMAFELAWKLLKDYLEAEGYDVKTPREAIKQAFQIGLIPQGHEWMAALSDRNLTTHTYNERTAQAVEKKIRGSYYPLLQALQRDFSQKVAD